MLLRLLNARARLRAASDAPVLPPLLSGGAELEVIEDAFEDVWELEEHWCGLPSCAPSPAVQLSAALQLCTVVYQLYGLRMRLGADSAASTAGPYLPDCLGALWRRPHRDDFDDEVADKLVDMAKQAKFVLPPAARGRYPRLISCLW